MTLRTARRLVALYLVVVTVAYVFYAVTVVIGQPGEPSFAGIYPIVATAPTSMLATRVIAGLPATTSGHAEHSEAVRTTLELALMFAVTYGSAAVNVRGAWVVARAVRTRPRAA